MKEHTRDHITHLLTRYVSGQLDTEDITRVAEHTAACASCRWALARHRALAGDMQQTLANTTPTETQIDAWWAAINEPRKHLTRGPGGLSALAATLLGVLLILAPFIRGMPTPRSANLTSTISKPALNITLDPPTLDPVKEPSRGFILTGAPITATPSAAMQPLRSAPAPPTTSATDMTISNEEEFE